MVLDNCPAHASSISIKVLAYLKVPLMFTAPASYAALFVEGIFALLKAVDFEQIADPDDTALATMGISRPTFLLKQM